jgi:hypothetical protein
VEKPHATVVEPSSTMPKDGWGKRELLSYDRSDEKGKVMRYIYVAGKKEECGDSGRWSDDVICAELESNSTCTFCKTSSVHVSSIASGPGNVRELIVKCNADKAVCGEYRQIYSGTSIMIKRDAEDTRVCPARNVEELNDMTSHWLNRGEPASLSRQTQSRGKAAITTDLYMRFLRWIFPLIVKLDREDTSETVKEWKRQSSVRKAAKKVWDEEQKKKY